MKSNAYQTLGLLLIAATLASAQGRFSVSVTGGPVVNHASARYTIFLPGSLSGPGGSAIITTVDNQSTKGGYSIGLSATYAFTPNWSISTGFWYNRLSMNGANPFNATPTPTRIISQDYQVPLLLNFRSGHQRLSPYFSAGALASFPQSTIYREAGNSGDSFKLFFSTSMDVRAVVGAGVAYTLNSHLSLIAQPLLIWHFKPAGDYERYVAYQVNGQIQLMYSF